MGTTTTKRSLYKPDNGETLWGDEVNSNFDNLDDAINSIIVKDDGVVVSSGVTILNFTSNLGVADNGGGQVTISGSASSPGTGSTDILMVQIFSGD